MKKRIDLVFRVISFLICFTIIFQCNSMFSVCSNAATATSVKELENKKQELQKKSKECQQKVAELKEKKAEKEKIIDALNQHLGDLNEILANIENQQSLISNDIVNTEAKISDLNSEIDDLDEQIDRKDEEIDETIDLFCKRIRANYIAGETSTLEIFTSSSSLSTFLNRLEMFKRVTDGDQKLVNRLHEEIAQIEKMQKKLEEKKAKLVDEKKQLVVKKDELSVKENELNNTKAEIQSESNEVYNELKAINYQTSQLTVSNKKYYSDMKAIDKEIKEYWASNGSNSGTNSIIKNEQSKISSTGWQWPVPDSGSYITSPYGYRCDPITGAYKFHGGIDISMGGAYGKPLVATKAGRVILASYTSTGYGNYVILDHGNGWGSLYGHCSRLNVSVGQSVSQGQVIAYIGSSGYSTGAHVHFEIRYNGDRLNPSNYVSK